MTAVPLDGRTRDSQDVDALVTDRYLESILAAHARGADVAPILADLRPDPDVRLAATRLALGLPRLHPSFRFEEALAGKLQEAAARMRQPRIADGGEPWTPEDRIAALVGRHAPFPEARDRDVLKSPASDPRLAIGRPLLVGGALTSAALSIAGAVYVAWRFRHPQTSPMARAIRSIARTRLA